VRWRKRPTKGRKKESLKLKKKQKLGPQPYKKEKRKNTYWKNWEHKGGEKNLSGKGEPNSFGGTARDAVIQTRNRIISSVWGGTGGREETSTENGGRKGEKGKQGPCQNTKFLRNKTGTPRYLWDKTENDDRERRG